MPTPTRVEDALASLVPLAALAFVAMAVRDGRPLTESESRRLMPDLTPDERLRVYSHLAKYKDR